MVETGSRILHLADLYEAATQGPPLNEPRAQADAYADLYRYVVTRADAAWVAGRDTPARTLYRSAGWTEVGYGPDAPDSRPGVVPGLGLAPS